MADGPSVPASDALTVEAMADRDGFIDLWVECSHCRGRSVDIASGIALDALSTPLVSHKRSCPSLAEPDHVRIESPDGRTYNTSIKLGDRELSVTKAVVTIDPREGFVTAALDLEDIDLLISRAQLYITVGGRQVWEIIADRLRDDISCQHDSPRQVCIDCRAKHVVWGLIFARGD